MNAFVLWQVILGTSVTALITDLAVGLAKKSPPYLIAPHLRLWKECSLLHSVLHNERFSNWKPQAARYVALQAIKAQGSNQESPQPVLDLLEAFLKRSEPVVLLGEPGAGKTTALEALTYRLSKRALLYNRLIWLALLVVTAVLAFAAPIFTFLWLASYVVWEPFVRRFTAPLFVEARSDYLGGDVNEWCEKIFKDRLGARPLVGARHRVAFFIDGVNEVQGSLYGGFAEGWRARLRDNRASRVIFTSRGGEEAPAQRMAIKNVLGVCNLDDDGVREFLKVYGREKAANEKSFYFEQASRDFDELQKKNLVGEGSIGRNPYWLKMIVDSGLYTLNRGALFRTFAEKLIRRETEEKPEDRKHKPDWKTVPVEIEMDALAALALAMHVEKRIGLFDEEGWNKARAAIRNNVGDLPYSPDDVLSEALASTLLRVQFKKRIEFVHQLVQEFFAAYALQPESKWREALQHSEDVWWWQTLFHLGGLVGAERSEPYSRFVRKVLGDGSNEERVFAAIGLMRSVDDTARRPYDRERLLKVVNLNALPTNEIVEPIERRGVDFTMTPQVESQFRAEGANLHIIEAIRANYRAPSELSRAVIEAFGRLMEKNLILSEGATTLNLTEPQRNAMRELAGTLGEEAAEAFAALLVDSRIEIQIIGILILSVVGNRRAAELILASLDDSIYKFVGIAPVARIGGSAVELLVGALRNKDRSFRGRAVEALVSIGSPSVEPLIIALRDTEVDVRRRAADALGQIGDARAVGPLLAALRVEGMDTRMSSSEALVQIGAPSVEPLVTALRDENVYLRMRAALALGRIRDARAIEPLGAALRDPEIDVRTRAVEALREIGDARAIEPLATAVRDPESPVRSRAVEALGEIGGAGELELLVAALNDEAFEVQWKARDAISRIGKSAFDPFMAALRNKNSSVRKEVAQFLGFNGDARAVEPLIAVLQDDEADVREQAVSALGRIGQRLAVGPLIGALKDVASDVRKAAAWALGRIGDPQAVEPLLAALNDTRGSLAEAAAYALGEIGDVRALEPLIAALLGEDDNLRRAAADALGEIGDAQALPALYEARKRDKFRSDPGTVVNEAEAAMKRIREYQEQKEKGMTGVTDLDENDYPDE